MKNKKRRVATNATLRKESKTFDGWLKYEVEVKNEDGSVETVPAYGKDLQDALQRVVHDETVKKIETKVIRKIPETGWAFAWFLGLAFSASMIYYNSDHKYAGFYLIGTLILYTFMTITVTNWFNLRNRDK